MDELRFDIRGNLNPNGIVEVTQETFEQAFISSYDSSSTRYSLYENYQNYMQELLKYINRSFIQWIDGSFVTNKENPKDIDLVTILDYRNYQQNKAILEKEFASFEGRKKYGVDAYIVANYPTDHKLHIMTQSDLLYWRNLFGRTRPNRSKKQFNKGIIQLNFTINE